MVPSLGLKKWGLKVPGLASGPTALLLDCHVMTNVTLLLPLIPTGSVRGKSFERSYHKLKIIWSLGNRKRPAKALPKPFRKYSLDDI